MTPIAPSIRTSATSGNPRAGASSSFSWVSIRFTFSCQPDSSNRRTEAQATAHASGLPINVGPCIKAPGAWLEMVSAIRLLVNTAESVIYPPVSALPMHMISGSTPACSHAKSLPVRPNPVAISSKIRRISCFRQSFSASRRYCG